MNSVLRVSKLCFSDLVAQLYEDTRLGGNAILTPQQRILIYNQICHRLKGISFSKVHSIVQRDMNILRGRANLKIFSGEEMTIEKLCFGYLDTSIENLTWSELLTLLNVYHSAYMSARYSISYVESCLREWSQIKTGYSIKMYDKAIFENAEKTYERLEQTHAQILLLHDFFKEKYAEWKECIQSILNQKKEDSLAFFMQDTLKADIAFESEERKRRGSAMHMSNIRFYEEDFEFLYNRISKTVGKQKVKKTS